MSSKTSYPSINIEDVIIPEKRIRKKFNVVDLSILSTSIDDKGLFHAPVFQNDRKTLLIGERRYRAMCELIKQGKRITYDGVMLPENYIPFITIGDLDPKKIKEAELEENTHRVDLTWQEKATAVSELHEFRSEEAAERGEIQTKTETTKEIYGEEGTAKLGDVSQDVRIAQYLDDPDVAKAPDRKSAMKIIERKLKQEHREKLAETYKEQKPSDIHTIINGDCYEELPKLPDDEFDLIINDPPYGVGADKFRNQSAVEHEYSDDVETADKIIKFIIKESLRITKPQAHLYMFHDVRRFPILEAMFKTATEDCECGAKAGELHNKGCPNSWYVWPWPMIWYRGSTNGLLPRPEHGPRRTYEAILYAIKGNKKTQSVAPDVLPINHERGIDRGAHKPVDLYEALINRSCLPGSKVLDPTAGTGPIIVAAKRANVVATAIEVDKAAVGIIHERLQKLDEGIDDEEDDRSVNELLGGEE